MRVDHVHLQAVLFQYLIQRHPPGRRWRTELPQRWPPSAAQTWCAVFPRHAFTKRVCTLQWGRDQLIAKMFYERLANVIIANAFNGAAIS